MQISIKAYELQVGDVYQNKTVVMVDAPENSAVVIVEFADGTNKTFDRNAELLVERSIKRVELKEG